MDQLLQAATSENPAIRQPAQQQLDNLQASNLAQYLGGLCTEFANPARDPRIRHIAGLQLKNLVDSHDDRRREELANRWMTLAEDVRSKVRELLYNSLSDATKDVRATAAWTIGKIAGIEVPRNLWPNVIELLARNVDQAANEVKEASFQALGGVCEEVDAQFLQAKANIVLTIIAKGMHKDQTNNAIKLAATTALANSLNFVKNNFKLQDDRNMIMAMIFSVATWEDVAVRVKAYECLVEIASTYYDYLPHYIKELFALTAHALQNEHDYVKLQAIEFWTTVADEERVRQDEIKERLGRPHSIVVHKFVELALPQLIPLLLPLLTTQAENTDDDTWTCAMATGICLGSIAQAVGDNIIPQVLPFVEMHIRNQAWRFREAAVLAFGYILEGPSPKGMAVLVKKALPFLIEYMNDTNPHVKDTASWTIGRVCDLLPRTIDETMLPALMDALLKGLSQSPKVAGNVCWAIHNLAEAVDVGDGPSSPLSPYFEGLMNMLIITTERSDADQHNLLLSAYETINVLIGSAAADKFDSINLLIQRFASKLQQSLAVTPTQEIQEQQGFLCSVLQIIIQRLPADYIIPQAENFMKLFIVIMGQRQPSVHEEAMMAVGALANKIGQPFETFVNAFMPCVMSGLTNWKEYQSCGVVVGVVGDMARALEEKLSPFCDTIMQSLLGNLANPMMERSVKPSIIACLGDISLAIGGQFERYMPYVMMMLAQASMTELDPDVGDNADYMRNLRENVLSAYTSIIQGLNTGNKAALFGNFLAGVVPFLDSIAVKCIHEADLVNAAVGLIGDIIQRIGAPVKMQLNTPSIQMLIKTAAESKDERLKATGSWTASLYSQLMRS